jgi:hypothetical protein
LIDSSLRLGGRALCARRPARAIAVTLGSLFVFLVLLAGTVAGVAGPTSLSNASVSPRSGSPTTRISFAVDYRNREGSAPAYVRVVIDGRRHDMRASGSLAYKSGVRFTYRTTLPAGTHRVSFQAADTRRFTASASGGTVRIQAASSGSGSGTSGGGGGSASGGSAGSGGSGGSGGSSGSGSSGGTTGSMPGAGAGGASSSGTETPTGTLGVTPEEFLAPVRVVGEDVLLGRRGFPPAIAPASGAGSVVPAPVDAGQPLGGVDALSGGLSALPPQLVTGGTGAVTWQLRAFAVAIGTGGAAALAMAFLFFGKRRRDGEQPAPDEVLQAAAATVDGYTAATQLVPPVAGPALDPAELAMPRWRRPSLLEARKKDPLRSASATYSLSFANGAVGLVDGLERRRIRYRVVRLLDSPDELRGTELGVLDQGDEVQLVERNGPFWFVRCPDGRQGWLHRMTLGDVVEDPPPVAPAQPTPAAQPAAPGDIPPATPDQDILSSFLRREQAG